MIFLNITGMIYKYDYSMDEGTAVIIGIFLLALWLFVVLLPIVGFLRYAYSLNKKIYGFVLITAAARFLQSIYILLWSLLFIIPGIIASYSYAMTEYILAEHLELSASEAISRSKQMMDGNKWRLFCLQFSFIGWSILCAFTLGIGIFWLTPYKQAATAAFYREVSGTECNTYESEWTGYTNQFYEEI